MEFGPIFRSMRGNRVGVLLIASELAISLAVILNCINLAWAHFDFVSRPTGLDVRNLIIAKARHWDDSLKDHKVAQKQIIADLESIRQIPGVIAASTVTHLPLGGAGSSWGRKPEAHPERDTSFAVFGGDEHALETYGLKLIAGRVFSEEEMLQYGLQEQQIHEKANLPAIITKELAEFWFPGEEAVGRQVVNDDLSESMLIVGVVELMAGSWPDWNGFYRNAIYPHLDTWGPSTCKYVIRTEPGRRDELMPVVEETLAANYDNRIIGLDTLERLRNRVFRNETAAAKLLIGICGLLVFVNGLGIAGLMTFWVSRRTRIIGIRRAVGARKWHVLRYFFAEMTLISAFGIGLGAVLATVLNRYIVANFDFMPVLPLWFLPAGMIALWILAMAAVTFPAVRATRIDPCIATRTV